MFIPFFHHQNSHFDSKLFDQTDFYSQFIHDLNSCKNEVVIESPFITSSHMNLLYPTFKKLLARNVHIHIITRDPIDQQDDKVGISLHQANFVTISITVEK